LIIKILKKIYLFILFIILIYFIYKLDFNNNEHSRTTYYVYIFITILLLFLIVFINIKYLINLTLLFFSIFLTLGIIEIILLKNSGYKFFYKYDYRNEISVYNQLKKNNLQTYLRTNTYYLLGDNEKNYSIIPFSGVSKSNIIMCNEGGFWATYFSDRYGFNNPDFVWNEDKIDFLLVGDSFTEGACVNEDDTISANLRRISNLTSISLGRAATGSLNQFAILREYLPQNTKRVVWIYYENDITDLEYEFNSMILNKYLINNHFSQNLINKQNLIDDIHIELHKKHLEYLMNEKTRINGPFGSFNTDQYSYLKLYTVRNFIKERFLEKKHEITPTKKNINDFAVVINNVNETLKEKNIKFYFVYISSRKKYSSKFDGEIYPEVLKIISNLNIPILDMHKAFKNHPDPLSLFPFRRQLHYNEKGYSFVAEKIYDFVRNTEKDF
jgi:hypothetical protein